MINETIKNIFKDFNEVRYQKELDIAKWMVGKYILGRSINMNDDDVWYSFYYGKINLVSSIRLNEYQVDIEFECLKQDSNFYPFFDGPNAVMCLDINHLGTSKYIFETEEECLEQIKIWNDKLKEIKESNSNNPDNNNGKEKN